MDFVSKGTEYAKQAVAADVAQDYESALDLYKRSVTYFMTAVKYEKNTKVQQIIREKTNEYLTRAEALQALLVQRKNTKASQPEIPTKSVEDDKQTVKLFLSYRVSETGKDGDRSVSRIQEALEQKGFDCYVGETELIGGQQWMAAINKALLSSHVFIPVISPTYGDSLFTAKELSLALNERKPIIPLWHSGSPHDSIKLQIADLQRIPFGNVPLVQASFTQTMDQLTEAIRLAVRGLK